MHITHASDVSAPVDFDPNYFESYVTIPPCSPVRPSTTLLFIYRKADIRPLVWGYKLLREIARRMPHFRGEPPMLHPAFPLGGPASVIAHSDGPVAFDSPRIVYSEEDERALEAFAYANGAYLIRSLLSTITRSLHSSSICLVPRDSGHGLALGEQPSYTENGASIIDDVSSRTTWGLLFAITH